MRNQVSAFPRDPGRWKRVATSTDGRHVYIERQRDLGPTDYLFVPAHDYWDQVKS